MKNLFLSFLLLLTFYTSFGQKAKDLPQSMRVDSLENVLKNETDDTNKIQTLIEICAKFWTTGKFDTAMACANSALALSEKLGYKKGMGPAFTYIGVIYLLEGNYPKALEYHFKALTLAESIGDKHGIALNLGNIGDIYSEMGNDSMAIVYWVKALPIAQELGNKYLIANNLTDISSSYIKRLDADISSSKVVAQKLQSQHNAVENDSLYKLAFGYIMKSLAMNREIGNKMGIADNFVCLGSIYKIKASKAFSQLGSDSLYKKSLEYYFKALSIQQEIEDKNSMSISLSRIGSIYTSQKNYKLAKIYLDSALYVSKRIDGKEAIKGAYSDLEDFDRATGNYKKTLEDYENYIIYRDSLTNIASTKAQMNVEFAQKQAAQKADQDKKDILAEADKHKQIIITWSVLGGLLLVLVFSGFIFRSLSITRKQKEVIGKQKQLVEEKNKDILDSIMYAKRLQDAILPPLSIIKQYLPESFLLYKPKDIVAGDFYWMERAGDTLLIAAADCTGHGVPGALVSVVCSNALNRTVKEFHITEPGKILDKVRELVLETFEKSENNVQDGMDISLCCINTKTKEVQWSGAYNSLWYIQHGKIHEVPADKQPIGKIEKPQPFNTHNLNLQKGDSLYLFTDGYADQFGGPKGKKFKYKQMEELLLLNAAMPMDEQRYALESTLEKWKGALEQVDDILIIGIRV